MACAALKRPYNFDILSTSPQQRTISPKRQRCGAVAVSVSPSTSVTPFSSATPKLSREELAKNVEEEWKRLQRRRKLMSFPSPPRSATFTSSAESLFPSASMSNTFWNTTPLQNATRFPPNHNNVSMSPPRSPTGAQSKEPTLKMKQVVLLVERLWKEREEKLREEYNQVLNERLSEQYDSFLKFTQDQIMRKYHQSTCSYVS